MVSTFQKCLFVLVCLLVISIRITDAQNTTTSATVTTSTSGGTVPPTKGPSTTTGGGTVAPTTPATVAPTTPATVAPTTPATPAPTQAPGTPTLPPAEITVTVTVQVTLSGDPAAFNQTAFLLGFAAASGIPAENVVIRIVILNDKRRAQRFQVIIVATDTAPAGSADAAALSNYNASTITANLNTALSSPTSPLAKSVTSFAVSNVTAETQRSVYQPTLAPTAAPTKAPTTGTTGKMSGADSLHAPIVGFVLAVSAVVLLM